LYTEVLKHCKEAADALQKRDNKALMTAKANVVKPMKDLGALVDPYEKALTDDWLKSHLAKSKDKAKIEAGIKGLTEMKTKASAELKKVANAQV
ncbi:MAG: hypothetical protein JO255_18600, partial [Alphaproteobacteria bacterium]|nr:hypothetical protein [Alphaproteobacteria bacterium]